jgi:hypothetical protein
MQHAAKALGDLIVPRFISQVEFLSAIADPTQPPNADPLRALFHHRAFRVCSGRSTLLTHSELYHADAKVKGKTGE